MANPFNALKRALAQSFLNGILTKQSRLYFYFGQITPFEVDSATASDNRDYINQTKNNIVAIKEVLPSDACFVVPRVNYEAGITYKRWNTKGDPWDYVYNPNNFSIYICVDVGAGVSVNTPTQTTIEPVTLADGYTWRYIYTVPLALRDRFLTPQNIPVANSLSEAYFSDGGIDSISILSQGEGYSKNNTSLVASGVGGKGHGAILEPVIEGGKIVSVIIHQRGYGYVNPTIAIVSTGQTKDAVITATGSRGNIRSVSSVVQALAVPGTLESIDILDGGVDYTNSLTLSVIGDGTGAAVSYEKNPSTGEVTKITLTNRGQGYTWAKIVSTDIEFGGNGLMTHINLSPIHGFGRDVVEDLSASRIMVYQTLSREKIQGLSIENSVYQYGLITDPKSTTSSTQPSSFVTKDNFVTTIPLTDAHQYTIGTVITNEVPVTANTSYFVVEEIIIGPKSAGIRLRATNGGTITSGSRYYKTNSISFVADYSNYLLSTDKQFVSACYLLEATFPNVFDINTFTVGETLTHSNKRYIIVAISTDKMLVSSIDGGVLIDGNILQDSDTNTIQPDKITKPSFDKKTGSLLTIEKSPTPIIYSQTQSVSFRTLIEF